VAWAGLWPGSSAHPGGTERGPSGVTAVILVAMLLLVIAAIVTLFLLLLLWLLPWIADAPAEQAPDEPAVDSAPARDEEVSDVVGSSPEPRVPEVELDGEELERFEREAPGEDPSEVG
jgi:hypothetical protein